MNTQHPARYRPITVTKEALSLFDQLSSSSRDVVAVKEEAPLPPAPHSVTARLEATVEGVCPYCQSQMRRSTAAGLSVWLCDRDRHVVPLRNSPTD